ncbi:MAG: 3-oxoacyl-[acyl-carrier protein] reductase [Solirubrobacteraceae bacterium]|jgi:3-oxoacyl-[acyl-carrier protein] reductase|nr:3-oxoacyl-[acyl-carrier protein] reductase [Solirubrobacteraceae bacterium]
MDLGIAGRVALVTGASKGLGRGIAAALVAEGAQVAITSRSRERVEQTAQEIGASAFVHDSADLDAVPGLTQAVADRLGPIDILVTNTGGPPAGPDPLGFPREQWEAAYRDLVLFPMALIDQVAPGMAERRWGRILNVSSIAVREPLDPLMLSNVHRAGTLAGFKTISRRLARDNVTLNSLLPGRIATDRLAQLHGSLENAEQAAASDVPAGRLGTVEEFAAAAAFLCSDRAGYITGSALPVDGGVLRSI